jgi:hypothetical protein
MLVNNLHRPASHDLTGYSTANNFNGDNLLECDQAVLKDLGIKKVGDRVRIFVAIKTLRNKAYANQKKRNRVCLTSDPLCNLLTT